MDYYLLLSASMRCSSHSVLSVQIGSTVHVFSLIPTHEQTVSHYSDEHGCSSHVKLCQIGVSYNSLRDI